MPKKAPRRLSIARMNPHQLEDYERTLHALGIMKREDKPLSVAAPEANTTPKTVRRLAGSALQRVRGRYLVKPRDRLERRMRLYDARGSFHIVVGSSTNATRIGAYHNALRSFLETGDRTKLQRFSGTYVLDVEGRRHHFVTAPASIRRLARAGQVGGFDGIY